MHYMDTVSQIEETIPVNIFLLKVSNRNTRKYFEFCSEVTVQT